MLNRQQQIDDAKKSKEILMEMSRLLGIGLDEELLSICIQLIETGMNPEVVANLVRSLQQEADRLTTNTSPLN